MKRRKNTSLTYTTNTRLPKLCHVQVSTHTILHIPPPCPSLTPSLCRTWGEIITTIACFKKSWLEQWSKLWVLPDSQHLRGINQGH